MNRMSEVAKILGVKVGERFDVDKGTRGDSYYSPYHIEEKGLVNNSGNTTSIILNRLLTGEYKIVKLPEND